MPQPVKMCIAGSTVHISGLMQRVYRVDPHTHNSERHFGLRSVLKDNILKNIYDFTTAGDKDCVVAVVRLSIVLILFSSPLESLIPLWIFEPIGRSLMRSNWLKLTSLVQTIRTLFTFNSFVYSLFQRITLLRRH